MDVRKLIIPGVMVSFALAGWASGMVFADLSENERLAGQIGLPKGHYIEGIRSADLNLDGNTDTVVLYAEKEKENDWFAKSVGLAVIDGATESVKKMKVSGFLGYEPIIQGVGDFTSDQKPEIFLSATTGGSGGYSAYAIIDFSFNEPVNILTPDVAEGIAVEGRYLDHWKAALKLTETGEQFQVDLSSMKSDYIEWGIYDARGYLNKVDGEGNLVALEERMISGYPFSLLTMMDTDGDGIYELMGSQRLIGVNNIERLSTVDTTLSYLDGKWQVVEASYRTYIR